MKIPSEWLTRRVDDAPTSYQQGVPPMAALRVRMAWQRLQREAHEGDEMWAFDSPADLPKRKGRFSGYALVREGMIVLSTVVTRS